MHTAIRYTPTNPSLPHTHAPLTIPKTRTLRTPSMGRSDRGHSLNPVMLRKATSSAPSSKYLSRFENELV